MNILPREKITYHSKLKQNEIIKRLSNNIIPKRTSVTYIFDDTPTKPYEGRINGQTFEIRRIINKRNSFLPKITGIVDSYKNETIIKVKMRLHDFALIFSCIWFAGVILFCIISLVHLFRGSEFHLMLLLPFGMLILFYALAMNRFKSESRKSIFQLQKIFKAEIPRDID